MIYRLLSAIAGNGGVGTMAWTCCDYSDALRERDGEGDRGKAMSLLDEWPSFPKRRIVVSCNPIHSGLAEGIGSAEMENLG